MRSAKLAPSIATLAALALVGLGATLDAPRVEGAEPPPLKEGLWSIHNREVDAPSNRKIDFTSTLCRSHASDQRARQAADRRKQCTSVSESLHANEYTVESRCKIKGSVVESKSTTLFRSDSTHTEEHVTYTPALNGITASTLIQDQKYLGKCPAGAEPGDLMLPNGAVQHLGRANEASRQHPQPQPHP